MSGVSIGLDTKEIGEAKLKTSGRFRTGCARAGLDRLSRA